MMAELLLAPHRSLLSLPWSADRHLVCLRSVSLHVLCHYPFILNNEISQPFLVVGREASRMDPTHVTHVTVGDKQLINDPRDH